MPNRLKLALPPPRSLAIGALWSALYFLLLLGQWRPLAVAQIRGNSGGSWAAVLGEAGAGRFAFGSELFFTGGPLSLVYTKYFHPDGYALYLGVSYFLIAFLALSFANLALRASPWLGLLLAAALVMPVQRDAWFLVVPFVTALIASPPLRTPASLLLLLMGTLATALATLAKFSVLPIALAAFVLADGIAVRDRRIPATLASYATAVVVAFQFVTTRDSDFGSYLRGSLETSSGYAAAMSLIGPLSLPLLFCAAVAVLLVAVAALERWRSGSLAAALRGAGPIVLVLLVFLWVAFKAAFVRYDRYHMTAFPALALGAALLCVARRYRLPAAALLVVASTGVCLFATNREWREPGDKRPLRKTLTLQQGVEALGKELSASVEALAAPRAWFRREARSRKRSLARIARQSPVQDLDGSIASVSAIQSRLIATGVDFRPHPSILEYTSYTRWIIDREREFLTSKKAPDYVLFQPGSIDNRYPTLAEGPTWPQLLSRYAPREAPQSERQRTLLLARRAQPLPDLLGPARERTASIGEPIEVPGSAGPVFVHVDTRLTLVGKLLNFLFRPPDLRMEVTLASGDKHLFRLIPGIVREGFLLSPLVQNAQQFHALASGVPAPERAVTSFRVLPAQDDPLPLRLGYHARFQVLLRPLDSAALARASSPAPASPAAAREEARAVAEDDDDEDASP